MTENNKIKSNKKKIRAIYAGSFDPVTFGHLDLVYRAAAIFSELTVAVADNMEKKTSFSLSERMEFLRKSLADLPAVEVDTFSGLLIDYAAAKDAGVLIRGLRAVSDFEYEFQMTLTQSEVISPAGDDISDAQRGLFLSQFPDGQGNRLPGGRCFRIRPPRGSERFLPAKAIISLLTFPSQISSPYLRIWLKVFAICRPAES